MQIIASVLNMPISVPAGDQPVALGAAMFAAVAAGLYADIPAAQKAIGAPIDRTYHPNAGEAEIYEKLYRDYKALGAFVEKETAGL
jgi:L-ribulokinase